MKFKNLAMAMAITAMPMAIMAQNKVLGAGIKAENMDFSVKPGTDFYQYACGGWIKKNPLPAAYSRYGSFDKLAEDNNKKINSILTDLSGKRNTPGSLEQKIGDLYNLAMDSVRLNKDGVAPLMPTIQRLEGAKSVDDLMAYVFDECQYGGSFLAYCGFSTDEKDAKNHILNIYQGGLSLGQRDYYVNKDEPTLEIMKAYREHIVKMFRLFGFSEQAARDRMERILSLENRIAETSLSATELRDVEANYNKMSIADFRKTYPAYPLDGLMKAKGINEKYYQHLVLGQPKFMAGLNAILKDVNVDDLRAKLEWDAINDASDVLGDAVAAEAFDFSGRVMSGRQVDHPRWRKATSLVQAILGEPLGKIYCERFFPASSKSRMVQLVKNLQKALGERIEEQAWMTPATKKVAREKLDAFYIKVGYPDKWRDYSGLAIDPAKSLYENLRIASRFISKQRQDEKVGKPVDRDEWQMTPQTVNAYYNPTTNEICFPAGILQYPFFDPEADDAFNYGAIGVVIGHEMTHGFDDQGCHFDKNGNMTEWWTKEDTENFAKLGEYYADFFSKIEVLPGLNANGKMTLGENIADHGGLMVAYQAFKNAEAEAMKVNKKVAMANAGKKLGLTADQRFFCAYSGVWGQNITEKEIRNRVLNDVHSLGEWRVKGALPHIDAWYKAFNIKPSDPLYIAPDKRLRLW